ncbi:MAG TPA: bifunctional shikimate kinase/3-dehydroquinate synthase [Solirubrobacteraceae bacterium]|nr:bifunctional shikimate kinase/3-dehydroquinate synthase [Solirubrobacteraceae bacterium]
MTVARHVVLVGFMGAGKTTAAHALARTSGQAVIDVDEEIVRRDGRSIQEIFAADGEGAFRELEERTALEVLDAPQPHVISLGGGALGSESLRGALGAHRVVWIDIDPETAWARAAGRGRPLAQERDAFTALHAQREPVYAAAADVVVPQARVNGLAHVLEALEGVPAGVRTLWATTPGADAGDDYPAYVGPGLLATPEGEREREPFWPAPIRGRRFLVTDYNAGRLYGERVGRLDGRVTIMPGEQSKTVAHAEIVWSELARGAMTRADIVVALGGGVVGDLAGFCAATYQRGVRVVQVPTTLVAQVDSAYGGKTGVDLAEAKNYVGAFHQPRAVIADTDALGTLPAEELAAGYAEVVKTALLAGGWLWDAVRAGAEPTAPEIVAGCAHHKLRVVASDERDTGPRQTLNLGHTVGHAIETVTGYARYRHGEAVGLGLLAALRLSGADALRAEVRDLLAERGLPTELSDEVDPDAVVMATARDKKRVGEGPVPFVLLTEPGAARPGCAVSSGELIAAVRELAKAS